MHNLQDYAPNSCLGEKSDSESDGSSDKPEGDASISTVEHEARRLVEVIRACIEGGLSSRSIEKVLKAKPLECKCSYKSIESFVKRQAGVQKKAFPMCPDGHMVIHEGAVGESAACKVQGCKKKPIASSRFWSLSLIGQLQALAAQPESHRQLAEGQLRAVEALYQDISLCRRDYYDGRMFRRTFGDVFKSSSRSGELVVSLRMTTDGFKIFEGRKSPRTTWPVAFTILNYDLETRFRAKNCLITCFAPGSHDSACFDTFLQPTIEELLRLEGGVMTACSDGQQRTMRAFSVLFTGDMPAVSKALGYSGHNATKPCRFCHFNSTYDPYGRCRRCIPLERESTMRTSEETDFLWMKAELMQEQASNAQYLTFVKSSGIKRRPALSSLRMDFTHGAPHDPMHLLSLGWVKHLTSLLIGERGNCMRLGCSHVLSSDAKDAVSNALRAGSKTILAVWGRPPMELSRMSSYKSEDWKMLGMHYGPALFNSKLAGPKISQLWLMTSQILHICFSAHVFQDDVEELRTLCMESLKLFIELFYEFEDHAHCFIPTTHAITHLHQCLDECGPLINSSQYVMERLIGELSSAVMSKKQSETQLLNSYHMQFSLNILQGGTVRAEELISERSRRRAEPMEVEEVVEKGEVVSVGKRGAKLGRREWDLVVKWAVDNEGLSPESVHDATTVPKVDLKRKGFTMRIESSSAFEARRKESLDARQRSFIAAHFPEQSGAESDTSTDEDILPSEIAVWYGCIKELAEVKLGGEHWQVSRVIAVVEWESSAKVDPVTGLPFCTRRQGRGWKGNSASAISIESVDRLIGFFDLVWKGETRRLYVDPDQFYLKLSHPKSRCQLFSARRVG